MIHVCMPLHDKYGTYSKYEGMAIYSLFSMTKSQITVHIIHDETLSDSNRGKFLRLAEEFGQTIIFHQLPPGFFSAYKDIAKHFSIGTLFRLTIPEIIPEDIEKVICLDADILVNIDITEMWKIDVDGYPLAACKDPNDINVIPRPCEKGETALDEYFNAGIIIFNLRCLRTKVNIREYCLKYLIDNPQCTMADQDALNSLLSKEYLRLDKKYNMFSRVLRAKKIGKHPCIVHVSGDYLNVEEPSWWDKLLLEYWKKSPWKEELPDYLLKIIEIKRKQIESYQSLASSFSFKRKKIVIWGIASVLWKPIDNFMNFRTEIDYAVDNAEKLKNTKVNGLQVYSPERLREEDKSDVVVIVLSERYYDEIKHQIESYGFIENKNFFDGRLFFSQNQGGHRGYF